MKKIILHIGYPKAASTTLQNELFMGLHRRGIINFLGRAWESDYYGLSGSKNEYKNLINHVIENDSIHMEDFGKSIILPLMSSELVNVYSEGLFLANENDGSGFVMPEKMNKLFSSIADYMKILVVIRSQVTLIMSTYVQRYPKIKEKKFSDYLDKNLAASNNGRFKIFNLYDTISEYAKIFGPDRINFIFFEDLLNDRGGFVEGLSSVFDVSAGLVDECLGGRKLNETRKESDVHICKKVDTGSLRWRLGRVLERLHLGRGGLMTVKIPVITKEQEKLIFETYRAGNLKLAREFSLDMEKMKKYRYV